LTTLAVWSVEWRLALKHPRPLVLRTLLPLALVTPIASGGLSARAASAAYVLIFTGLGVLGAALTLNTEAERGLSARVVRAGVPPASYLLQRAAAGASLDTLRLLPALAVVALGAGASLRGFALAIGVLMVTSWLCTLVGSVIGCVSRSLGEAGILTLVVTFFLAYASGVFGSPAAGSASAWLETVAPFTALREALLAMASDAPTGGSGSWALAGWAVLLPLAITLRARRMCGFLGRGLGIGYEGV